MKIIINLALIILISAMIIPSFTGEKVLANDSYEMTFYPDAHPENTSVDGNVYHVQDNTAWATIRNGAGTGSADSGTFFTNIQFNQGSVSLWMYIVRGIYLFDTSGLPDDCIKTEAIFSLRGRGKSDPGDNKPGVNVYSSNPASNNVLVPGDYTSLGSVPFSNTISYDNFSLDVYNDFVLNESGLAAINLTGITKLGTRNPGYDVANIAPSVVMAASLNSWASEQGEGYKPKLVVRYIFPNPPSGVTSFEAVRVGDYSVNLTWSKSGSADGVQLMRSYESYLTDNSTGFEVYKGTAEYTQDKGCPDILPLYYSIWEYNNYGWSGPANYYLGGEAVNITMNQPIVVAPIDIVADFPLYLVAMGFLVFLLLIAFFIKSPFLSLAVFCITIYLATVEEIQSSWVLYAVACIMGWSLIASVKRFIDWRAD